jgi:hypothetical protein
MLHSVNQVQQKIAEGKTLLLAGSEGVLSQLPKGKWIGGTIPYFMDVDGGVCSESQIFVTELPEYANGQITNYSCESIPNICSDAPDNGYSFLIIPAGSSAHKAYAQDAPTYKDIFLKPVVGWVAGVHLSQLGHQNPKVFNGSTGQSSAAEAIVMHVTLPPGKMAELEIINVFKAAAGDVITFPASGFSTSDCFVNGRPTKLAQYFADKHIDQSLPLTADYNGSTVNVSVQSVNGSAGTVDFYAPVFQGLEYRIAEPVPDYMAAFASAASTNHHPDFTCNCILNYVNAKLEGKRTENSYGPITFGEIAHQLLNQTMVHLMIHDVR